MSSSDDETCAATLRLVGAYQSLLGQKRWETWIDLWAEDGVFDFPFAPHGRQRTYRGKAEILAYMSATPGRVAVDAVDQMRLFPMQDPETVVVELSIKGHAPATGAPYNQAYVLFFETKCGKLWRYREYWNPTDLHRRHGRAGSLGGRFGSPLPAADAGGAA